MVEALWGDVKPPKGSRKIGETADGTPIWRLEREVVVEKRPVTVNGEPQYVKVNGEIVKARMEKVMGMETVEFTMVAQPNGGAFMNPHFRPDPEEQGRLERRKKVNRFMEQFAEAAVDRGIDDPAAALALLADAPAPRKGR